MLRHCCWWVWSDCLCHAPPQLVRYLCSAQEEYRAFFQRMRSYYQPDRVPPRPEDRLLHHAPNGLHS